MALLSSYLSSNPMDSADSHDKTLDLDKTLKFRVSVWTVSCEFKGSFDSILLDSERVLQ